MRETLKNNVMKSLGMLFLMIAVTMHGFCQYMNREVIASAGKSSQNLYVQVDWTVGELIVKTFENEQCVLSQGFHQTKLILSSIGIQDYPDLSVRVFPNPARDYISIEMTTPSFESRIIQLIDMRGRVRFYQETAQQKLRINLLTFDKGVYFLRIIEKNGKYISSYKIIKLGLGSIEPLSPG